jgi:hypothetical protein
MKPVRISSFRKWDGKLHHAFCDSFTVEQTPITIDVLARKNEPTAEIELTITDKSKKDSYTIIFYTIGDQKLFSIKYMDENQTMYYPGIFSGEFSWENIQELGNLSKIPFPHIKKNENKKTKKTLKQIIEDMSGDEIKIKRGLNKKSSCTVAGFDSMYIKGSKMGLAISKKPVKKRGFLEYIDDEIGETKIVLYDENTQEQILIGIEKIEGKKQVVLIYENDEGRFYPCLDNGFCWSNNFSNQIIFKDL